LKFEDIKLEKEKLRHKDFDKWKFYHEINSFFHYGINFDERYDKREIIENAMNDTRHKLIDAIKNGSTHVHKKNMMYTFKRLIEMYERSFIHEDDHFGSLLAEVCLTPFKENKELIEKIEKIILKHDFTHWEQNILLRPYLFDFENYCRISWSDHYKDLRKKLEEKLSELIRDELDLEQILDPKVLKIIKVGVE